VTATNEGAEREAAGPRVRSGNLLQTAVHGAMCPVDALMVENRGCSRVADGVRTGLTLVPRL